MPKRIHVDGHYYIDERDENGKLLSRKRWKSSRWKNRKRDNLNSNTEGCKK